MNVLDDPVFLRYLLGVGGFLSFAGLVLAFLRVASKRDITQPARTYRGWLLIVPVVVIVLAAGRLTTILGIGVLAWLAMREFRVATGLDRSRTLVWVAVAGGSMVTLLAAMPDPRLGIPGWYGMFMALPAYMTCAIFAVPALRGRTRGQLQATSLAVVMFLYFGWALGHLQFLANLPRGRSLLLFLLTAVSITDVASYLSGRVLGQKVLSGRALAPQVSPAKTWAGALGGLVVGFALPWLLAFSLPGFGLTEKLLTGLLIGVGAPLGDLTISVFKRDLGIKDMGTMLPGHGGILDRIDSLLFVAPLFFHMVRWFRVGG